MQTSGVHHLDILSDEYSWMLFEKLAFADGGATKTQDLVDVGKRILKKCGGVPLAIKVIGGLLYSKKDASEWSKLEKSEVWNESTDIAKRVMSVLKLSYENLPSWSVKQCFASCSIFLKDADMEKESLIQIWMAQGLINDAKGGGGHLQMEDIGSDYFNILLRSSLLQATPKYGIEYYRMHDLVHDLSLQVSNNRFFNTRDGMEVSHDDEVMHLTILGSQGKVLKNIEGIPPNLQTLYYLGGDGIMLEDILERSRYLSVLIVDSLGVTHLPNSVGDMKHLRHLDIRRTGITALPNSITKLYDLMTLKVCYLEEMPKKFGNLINLRHFEFSSAMGQSCFFPGIGQLANLRTLPHFRVSQDKGCQLEELEHLRNLRGELKISGLENVSSFESAGKAKLSEKSSIQGLRLSWNGTKEDCDDNNINSVMEGLQPHPDLKSLAIWGFQGSRYPSWMVAKDHLTVLLRNLVEIKLSGLGKCEQVPPLGDLPCLESLEMESLHNVKRIGAEFYGLLAHLDINARSSACSSSSSRKVEPITLFPKLSSFVLCDMKSLEEWSDAMVPSDSSSSIKVFPNLRYLRIERLPKLAVLPDMENLTSLAMLEIWRCGSLACIRNLNSLTSLESLYLNDCSALLDASLESLRTLSILGCDKLNPSLSNNLEKLTSLERLEIFSHDPGCWPIMVLHHLANLRSLTLGGFSDDLDHFPWPHSITNLVSLERLELRGWPKITSLPYQIQHLSTLRTLEIGEFEGLEVLPEWMGSLRNLRELWIVDCSNLRQLPSAEATRHLTNLNKLYIDTCPLLAERCTKGSGAEWPKIAHIPLVID
ncbi:disease resistance protein RGA2-like [Coffea arabica]|uniref:Disease resistance protein RGA2-like n=1 Tax=Coffea arabica TaxID=13443 RepID=A0A6P6S4V4_COFAR|nr:putative disease resistance protein RGA3 [Coffea arabica]